MRIGAGTGLPADLETHARSASEAHARSASEALITVSPAEALVRHRRLFTTLEAAFAVRFTSSPETGSCAAIVIGEDSVPSANEATTSLGVPVLALASEQRRTGTSELVRLCEHQALDRRIRGIQLPSQQASAALAPGPGEEVLAVGPSGAAWTRTAGAMTIHRVRSCVPGLTEGAVLRQALDLTEPSRALATVALVHFLREVTVDPYEPAPMRASFVFDDPNLRRSGYGHIDYRRLIQHADAHGYHAAMALVPLDARTATRRAIDIFRARPDRLSLVIHGNDHERRELMRPESFGAALAVATQALRRIRRFEARSELRVGRVMMPPHGLCSRIAARAIGALGYDALCAIHPCPWTEEPLPERCLAGWMPADFLDGCAIIPRFTLNHDHASIALRAFLDQPLILYGHHSDLASGLEPLSQAAARVNRLGPVRWCSPEDVATSNHLSRVCDGTLEVFPGASRLRVAVPDGVRSLRILPPRDRPSSGVAGWSCPELGDTVYSLGRAREVVGNRDVTIRLHSEWETAPSSVGTPPFRLWPRVRRRVAEGRDRLEPFRRTVPRANAGN